MSDVFAKVITLGDAIVEKLSHHSVESTGVNDARFPWRDSIYHSHRFRRAHLNIVDARDTLKIWMMHFTIFPHANDPSPIFGLDIVAGANRISGAFHDFSKAGDSKHFMMQEFANRVKDLSWKKERELPDWAKQIFSPSMVAVGAMDKEQEIDQLIEVALGNLDYYLEKVGETQESLMDYHMAQNRYCYYQKQNPHNGSIMQKLGLSAADARKFVEEVMFPEIG